MYTLVFTASLLTVTCLGAPSLDGKIIGGRDVDIRNFPYQVSFEYFGSMDCGAAIISEDWVVTAAHCVEDVAMNMLVFRAGTSFEGVNGTVHEVAEIYQHPNFDYDAHDFDIAVIKVKTPFVFGVGVEAIPLATEEPAPGQMSTVSGWGNTGPDETASFRLQAVDLPIVDRKVCAEAYKAVGNVSVTITENMICAGSATGENDTCKGDSGGPLVSEGKLVGIVSFGAGCAVPGYPGVYSNVAKLVDFVVDTTGVSV